MPLSTVGSAPQSWHAVVLAWEIQADSFLQQGQHTWSVAGRPPQTVLWHAADNADGVGSTAAAIAAAAGSVVVGSAHHSHVGGSMVLLLEPAAA